jgi:ABC-2 type transport system ATP-binding protein
MRTMIELTDLTFDYPGIRALDAVSCRIDAGSITALVGPNGAGKTTLMRCLCGLERPLAGRISVDGIDVIDEPRRSHERLGYLSDFFGLYEDLTVDRCLRHAAAAHGMRGALDGPVRDTATRLGLADRLDQRAGDLSRGLRQRVAIAQAMIHAPRVLVLDEPAAGLDPEARHTLATLFRALQAGGMTLLVSSHILSELEQYATHMLVLEGGRLLEHRALAGMSDQRRTLALTFSGDAAALAARLGARSDVQGLDITPARAVFDFAGDERAQAALLRDLVLADLAILSFGPASSDLQERYLATVGQHRAGA